MKTNIKPNHLFSNDFTSQAGRVRRTGLAVALCLLGFLLSAWAQDPVITNTNHPLDTNVSAGASVRLYVYASTTNGPLTIQWQHEGTNLSVAGQLYIPNVTAAHAGKYVAWVTNTSGGFTNTRTATLTVDPTFTKLVTGVIVTDAEGSISGSPADYDNDGYVDLFLANADLNTGVRNTLYHNLGGTNFVRVTVSPFTTDYMRAWMAAWADYNNDGNVDLVVGNLDGGATAQRLYRNNGGGSFTVVADPALPFDTTRATCPWWIDYDNDGFLDLFMAKGMYLGGGASDRLFRNNGDGTFKKMTAAEVGQILNDQSLSMICFSIDYDNDGRQELVIQHERPIGGISYYTNLYWRYQADGTFVRTTPLGIPADSGLTGWWADYDNDGWLDLFSADSLGQTLFRNLGAGNFADVTSALNAIIPSWYTAAAWGDYDNDGWLDMFCVGPYWASTITDGPTNTQSSLFHNNRDGTFTQILTGSPVYDEGRRMTASWTDYNNDGFLDLFIAVGDAKPEKNLLYRNNGNTNHWLKVKLDGRASNRSGIGARVRARATINGQTFWQMREISCENAFAGQNGLLAHFGLGDATNVTTLRIEWPSGIVQELPNVAANQFLKVVESQSYTNTNAIPKFIGAAKVAGGMELSFSEPATNAHYILEASTNLTNWTKLVARTSLGVATNYTDTRAANYANRYYRLLVP